MSHMRRFDHVGITVADLDRATLRAFRSRRRWLSCIWEVTRPPAATNPSSPTSAFLAATRSTLLGLAAACPSPNPDSGIVSQPLG